jgi:GAF domain-containing protein
MCRPRRRVKQSDAAVDETSALNRLRSRRDTNGGAPMETIMIDETRVTEQQQPVVRRLLSDVLREIDGAMHASIALRSEAELRVIASTSEPIDAVGGACDGPTTAVMERGQIVRIPTVQRSTEFQEYIAKCRRLDISSMAGFPIMDHARRTVGVLTVSSADHHGFGPTDLRAGRRIAEVLAAELQASTLNSASNPVTSSRRLT